MYRFPSLPSLLAITLCLYSSLSTAIDTGLLRLATTSSVQNSSLLEQLVRRFEQESDYQMRVYVVGSGAALRMGRKGLADAIISHSPKAEILFMQEGHGAVRQPLMHNEFVLVGPADDPADIRGLSDTVQALKRIAMRSQTFVSRADESGTHKRERQLWRISGFNTFGKPWYQEAGMGMGDSLKLGDELQAYMLVDRGTWLAMRTTLKLVLLSFGDPRLINTYSVIAVSENSHREVNENAGRAFVDLMTSNEVQALIGAFRVDGELLFTPANGVR
jgi:tungstate transport system substrate-binding protein